MASNRYIFNKVTLVFLLFFWGAKKTLGVSLKDCKIGVAANVTYLNPLFKFSGTKTDFTKKEIGYRPEFFVQHLSAFLGYKKFILEYTQYSSYGLCAFGYSNNSSSFKQYGITINNSGEFTNTSFTELKRHSLVFSRFYEDHKTNFELGGGIAIGNTTGSIRTTKTDSLSTPNGKIQFVYSKNVPSPINFLIGLRLGIDHEFLFKGLHVFANVTYFQGLINSENITNTTTFNSTSVYYQAISRSSTISGTIGIRYFLDLNWLKNN